ncbi:MAG: hypothetical protein ACK5M4_12800 [Pseudorhodobacter sp.]
MPYLLGLLALAGAVYFWMVRARNAADMAGEMADMAGDVMAAARRFGFRRKTNIHPVDAVEDPRLAIAGAGVAFLEIGALPSEEQYRELARSLETRFTMTTGEADEALIMGRWLSQQSNGGAPAFTRLLKRLRNLQGGEGFDPLMAVLRDAATAAGTLSPLQKDALEEVKIAFRLR